MPKKIRFFLFVFALTPLLHAALTPPAGFTPVDRRIGWKQDGRKLRVLISEINGRDFISISQLAAVSGAGLDWQPVSNKVCLTRSEKSECFGWGAPSDETVHSGSQVYLPVRYLLSEDFQKFSNSQIAWNEKNNEFIQTSPVSISLPPVENLGDRYRLQVSVADGVRYELLERNDRRIWLRLIGGRSAGSAILEGDNVIQRVRLVQKRFSTDIFVEMGGAAIGNDVYFDQSEKKLVMEVERREPQLIAKEPDPIVTKKETTVIPVPAPVIPTAAAPRVEVATKREKPKPATDTRVRTIVIDPGHGGHDAGAIGVRGTYEKDINLKVAKLLAERLSKEKNLRVILTRNSDEFIPLAGRTEIANDARADLFVSIHCNSSLWSKHSGLEVYVLSPSATDEAAEAVARVENSVIALESKKGEKRDKLSTLLASMAVNNYINESLECATLLGRAMKTHGAVNSAEVKEANFYVLRGAQMPSVLVELEYVSNPIAELKLRSSRYQSQLAKAIAAGVIDVDKRFRKKQESMAARNKTLEAQQ